MELEIGQRVEFTRYGTTVRGTIVELFTDDRDGTRRALVKIPYKFDVIVLVDELSDDSGTDHRAAYIESLLTGGNEMTRVEAKFLCECENPEPFVYGNFDPPCYVCRRCGLNVTERVEDGGILDTSRQCRELLRRFLNSLRQIQERVESLDGTRYSCFLFEYNDCLLIGSPVCKVCHKLNKCGYVATWKENR